MTHPRPQLRLAPVCKHICVQLSDNKFEFVPLKKFKFVFTEL